VVLLASTITGHEHTRGKAMFQMLGVFSEFEREIIRERVNAPRRLAAIRRLRKQGDGINKIARQLGIGVSVVQRIVAQ
jgi:DNA invertase Pin-like site-specific DNA recombinase